MSMIQTFLKELQQEAKTTRKMLALVPDGQYQWKPHEKSMTIQQLATHVAELPGWVTMVFNTNELDFATAPYEPKDIGSTAGLLDLFEKSLADGKASLEGAKEEQLDDLWTLREGETIYSTSPKAEVIRMAFSQIIHHRAQLGVYLRLLNIPIPGSYGPSADDMSF
ncbi:MAG: DinB family protein [Ferruginibacter sp.]|nr:DinB family protein [Ferruginibacter sp.]